MLLFSSIVLAPLDVSVSDHCFSNSLLSSFEHLHHMHEYVELALSTPILITIQSNIHHVHTHTYNVNIINNTKHTHDTYTHMQHAHIHVHTCDNG